MIFSRLKKQESIAQEGAGMRRTISVKREGKAMPEQQLRRDQVSNLPSSDEVVKDLMQILREAGLNVRGKQTELILTQLLPYIVRRDHQVFNHAYNVGRSNA